MECIHLKLVEIEVAKVFALSLSTSVFAKDRDWGLDIGRLALDHRHNAWNTSLEAEDGKL